MLCVFLAAAFLKYSKQCRKIGRKSLHQQAIETFLLIGFDQRLFGLLLERSYSVRIVISSAILAGLILRKCFGAQLNAIWAFDSFDFVSDLNASLSAHPEIKTIITPNFIGEMLIKEYTDLEERYEIKSRLHPDYLQDLKELLNNESVYFAVYEHLRDIQQRFPFLPTKLSKLNGFLGETAMFYFPIYKGSPHFRKIFKR